jgi:hypothetical protein
MPWSYSQSAGSLSLNGTLVASDGYSGAGAGRNNGAMEGVRNVGPIPRGAYRIGPPYNTTTHGPHVMALTAVGHNALGRSAFLMHGDNRTHTASQGCIIFPRSVRNTVSASSDKTLNVVQ